MLIVLLFNVQKLTLHDFKVNSFLNTAAIYNRARAEQIILKINLICRVDTCSENLCIHSFDLTNHFHPLALNEKCISLCQEILTPSIKDLKDVSYALAQE